MPKLFLYVCFIALFPFVAVASDYVEKEDVKARLAIATEGENAAVIDIVLAEGWHSYGDPPGDAGLPPRFDWTASENLKDIEVTLPPTFKKREMDLFEVNAYKGQIFIPLKITAQDNTKEVDLKLKMTIMICKDICIPEEFDLELTLEPQDTKAVL